MRKRKDPKSPSSPRKALPGGLASASAAMKEAAQEVDAREKKSKPANRKPRTREGKKGLVLYVLPEVTVALRMLALENGSDVQSMGHRALELLFAEYDTTLPGTQDTASNNT